MKTLFHTAAIALFATSLMTACSQEPKTDVHASPSGTTLDKAKEAMDSTKASFEKVKSDYKAMLDMKLADVDKHIQELKDKAAKATDVDKADLDKLVADLETKRKAAGEKLGEWKQAGADGWKSFTAQVDQAVMDLDAAARKALGKK